MNRTVHRCGRLSRVAGLIACAATAAETAAQTNHDAGGWFAIFGNGRIESREESPLRWWLDGHFRLLDDAGGFNQFIIRPGLGYALSDEHTLWQGYAYIRTSPAGSGKDFDEHRTWQQWMYAPTAGDWSFVHRSRLEQRWVETGSDVGLRWRQMLRVQYKLPDAPRWSLIAWNEAFFHLNDTDWGARAGFDQNRAFLGVGFKPAPDARVRIEVGYLNQFIHRRGGEHGMNHILSLNLFF